MQEVGPTLNIFDDALVVNIFRGKRVGGRGG